MYGSVDIFHIPSDKLKVSFATNINAMIRHDNTGSRELRLRLRDHGRIDVD